MTIVCTVFTLFAAKIWCSHIQLFDCLAMQSSLRGVALNECSFKLNHFLKLGLQFVCSCDCLVYVPNQMLACHFYINMQIGYLIPLIVWVFVCHGEMYHLYLGFQLK